MSKTVYTIEFYKMSNGKKPVEEFLLSLDNKMRTKAIHELILLREKGPELREPFSKVLENGVCELRVQQGSNKARVFYFFFQGKRIILTNGFLKKTQKTPAVELEKARRYKKDYEERKHG